MKTRKKEWAPLPIEEGKLVAELERRILAAHRGPMTFQELAEKVSVNKWAWAEWRGLSAALNGLLDSGRLMVRVEAVGGKEWLAPMIVRKERVA